MSEIKIELESTDYSLADDKMLDNLIIKADAADSDHISFSFALGANSKSYLAKKESIQAFVASLRDMCLE